MSGAGLTVGIFGATGNVGKQLLQRCIDSEYNIKVLARKPEKLADFATYEKLEIIKGSIESSDVVASVVQGTDVVVSTLGNVGDLQIMDTAALNILAANPKRVITLSSLGVEQTSCCTWFLLRYVFGGPGFDDYEAADKRWRESDSNVTIIRGCNLEGTDPEAKGYGTEEEGFSWSEITKPAMGDWLFEEIENKNFEGKKRVQVYQEGSGVSCCCKVCCCCFVPCCTL